MNRLIVPSEGGVPENLYYISLDSCFKALDSLNPRTEITSLSKTSHIPNKSQPAQWIPYPRSEIIHFRPDLDDLSCRCVA